MFIFILFAIFVGLLLLAVGMIGYIILFSILPLAKGAVYASTNKEAVKRIVHLANIQQGEKAVDIGSGDGRIVIALAQAGAIAYGYEINPLLVLWSRFLIKKARLQNKAFIFLGSFWHQKFTSFDIVTVYGIPYIMKELEKKLQHELQPGARIISQGFAFPAWQCQKQSGHIYLYNLDKKNENDTIKI